MLNSKALNKGSLEGTIYDFTERGDVLEPHTHMTRDTHISIVAKGSFRAFGTSWELVAKAGDVLDFKANQLHGFEALEDNSRLVNIRKYNDGAK